MPDDMDLSHPLLDDWKKAAPYLGQTEPPDWLISRVKADALTEAWPHVATQPAVIGNVNMPKDDKRFLYGYGEGLTGLQGGDFAFRNHARTWAAKYRAELGKQAPLLSAEEVSRRQGEMEQRVYAATRGAVLGELAQNYSYYPAGSSQFKENIRAVPFARLIPGTVDYFKREDASKQFELNQASADDYHEIARQMGEQIREQRLADAGGFARRVFRTASDVVPFGLELLAPAKIAGVGQKAAAEANGGPSRVGTPSLTLVGSVVVLNQADGGAAGVGGSAGLGVGGGLYLAPGGLASADFTTVILANHASTSDDDVFGLLV
jgi:hypothetical protein